MNFKIYEDPYDKKDKHKHLIPPILTPKLRLNLVGPSQSGKTQFMMNIMFNWLIDYYKKKKAKIIFMTSTQDTAIHISTLAKKHRYSYEHFQVYDYFDMNELKEIYDEHDGKTPLIFVLDDCGFLDGFSSSIKKGFLDEIYSSGRHKNTSILCSLQKFYYLNESCRSINATHLIIYKLSQKEQERLYIENLSSLMTENEFKRIIRDNLKEKFQFIIIDNINKKLYNNKMEEIKFDIKEKKKENIK